MFSGEEEQQSVVSKSGFGIPAVGIRTSVITAGSTKFYRRQSSMVRVRVSISLSILTVRLYCTALRR